MKRLIIVPLLLVASCNIVSQRDLDLMRAEILLQAEDGLTQDELDYALAPLQSKVDANATTTEELTNAAKDVLPAPLGSILATLTALAGAYGMARREAKAVDRRRDLRRLERGERTLPE